MPSFPSPEPKVSYSNDLDFFKDFENEFPAIVYNDALTSKSDFLTEHIISPQHIDEFNNETSLPKCDEKEQNILYLNDLLPFNVIYPDDLKWDMDYDNDKIDIEQPSGDMSIIPSLMLAKARIARTSSNFSAGPCLTTDENGVETKVPPKTAQALLARQRERKAKSILLLAIPDEYQLRFHAIKDAKTLWAAIKSRFGGNVEYRGCARKNVLMQNLKIFSLAAKKANGLGYDWSYLAQDEPTEFDFMAYTTNSLGPDTERQTLSKSNLEIVAYPLGLESVEAQLIVIRKMNQLSTKDKTGLGYRDQLNENDSSGSELFNNVFDSRSSDGDDNQTNDRFKKDNGYHVVPPPLTRNYMPPLADLSFCWIDDCVY
ncbi:hypothetical protein Tco_1043027 [Tanacetum coccineum]|uniref:Uncharacterized protein n=1 Tax=Tanacetum coccineum TaxID=301880 RepID=A0ABQ5GMX6_9ASTR